MSGISPDIRKKLQDRLAFLYPNASVELLTSTLLGILESTPPLTGYLGHAFTEKSNLLITYADTIQAANEAPLRTLKSFLDTELVGVLESVHLLPFYPWTSDDGFSVSDYDAVDPSVGGWDDVRAVADNFRLMFDLVLNHCSASHRWFKDYLAGEDYCQSYFIEADPSLDYSMVVRPRSLPLLTPFQTSRGERHLWTTFSADQIDLNFKSPALLFEMVRILLRYLREGASIVRFDAPTYLWKELGTPCVSLPQTHAVMKLFRDIFDAVAPGAVVLTETNVPHLENISYFGSGDEAHMVYNFALPPLLLHGLRRETSKYIKDWAASLGTVPAGCTFLNFTASHDGIGVRGLKGIVPDSDVDALVEDVRRLGGRVSTRRISDGSDIPYELNISYIDALSFERDSLSPLAIRRFLTSQYIAIALRGVPAIYIQNLIGGTNDYAGLAKTDRARTINRRKWQLPDLRNHLRQEHAGLIFSELKHALTIRGNEPNFHPEATQEVLHSTDSTFIFRRSGKGGSVVVAANFSGTPQTEASLTLRGEDLLTGREFNGPLTLQPFETVWIRE